MHSHSSLKCRENCEKRKARRQNYPLLRFQRLHEKDKSNCSTAIFRLIRNLNRSYLSLSLSDCTTARCPKARRTRLRQYLKLEKENQELKVENNALQLQLNYYREIEDQRQRPQNVNNGIVINNTNINYVQNDGQTGPDNIVVLVDHQFDDLEIRDHGNHQEYNNQLVVPAENDNQEENVEQEELARDNVVHDLQDNIVDNGVTGNNELGQNNENDRETGINNDPGNCRKRETTDSEN
ncbi:unnamed protein product [Oikopleura dioica]|uniref:Uncharacterized protein n=1 Tax=Oikopleura dioica TaxID=34765 RepID=E4YSI3_OIKDI|nr:unnamed protein product [Oikopleura dioica]